MAPGIAPSLTLLPPPNAASAQLADEWAQRKLAQQSQRRRLVQRSARLRQAAAERGAAERARIADQAAVVQQTRGSEKGIDLIGDLIRGLGLGRGQQG